MHVFDFQLRREKNRKRNKTNNSKTNKSRHRSKSLHIGINPSPYPNSTKRQQLVRIFKACRGECVFVSMKVQG